MMTTFPHLIIPARDAHASAAFVADLLGLPSSATAGRVTSVRLPDGGALEFATVADDRELAPQHYGVALDGDAFEDVLARVRERRLLFWGDPHRPRCDEPGDARAISLVDPSGHWLEVIG